MKKKLTIKKPETPASQAPVLSTEEDVLKFWDENKIFEKSIANRAKGKEYSFYDGPPFATGKPHHGHILATTIKDTVARFWTMKGYKVERRVGWDCHGLPVENLIEKEMGIRSKKDIETMGIEKFNEACRKAVFRSVDDFEKTLKRVGRWADYSNAYATLDLPYMESVWWVFKQIYDQELAYQDFRVTPYCPRCGTPLSNFEVNLNYKDDTIDPSVYIKFPIKKDARYEMQDSSFLVWTTTPWTLHGNVALAINPRSVYAKVKHNGEELVLAKARLSALGGDVEIIEEMLGEKLIGLFYEPLYPAKDAENGGYKVMAGDFVSMEDGTGIVHIAPAFGVDDYQMHKQRNLPIINNISLEGRFFDITQTWNGKKAKDADKDIIEDLRTRGLLFKAETIKHTYPFCWRCEHYLIYYAIESWYIGVTKVKDQLIKNNKKIHWMPRHLKDGRFGKWLEGARDWAVSRSRFWGAPLPVWECEKGHREVFGNISDLAKKIPGNTTFTFIRHGESEHNAKDVCNGDPTKEFHLTARGRRQVEKSAKELAKQKFDIIFCSDFIRAHETAEILQKHIKAEIKEDKRLGDINVGECEGLPRTQCRLDQSKAPMLYEYCFPGGESLADIEKRMTAALGDIEKQYPDKNVLVVSHEDPIKTVYAAYGLVRDHDVHSLHIGNGMTHVFESKAPKDLHRPYIDKIAFPCSVCGEIMARIPDVFDCWFESGSMPYAQWHYPFENKDLVESTFPADFIAEGLDQTRGWFYTLHVLATILTKKNIGLGKNNPAFKNVVVNGLILAQDGKKLSKKLKNYTEPEILMQNFGADALRLFLLASTPVGEDYRLSDKAIESVYRNTILIVKNVLNFYETYSIKSTIYKLQTTNSLDKWILARLSETSNTMTKGMETYDLTRASRPLLDFITDLSVWYVRRSRERIKDPKEGKIVSEVLRQILSDLSKLMAPFMPFTAEMIYQKTKSDDTESVHLADWPKISSKFKVQSLKLLKEMELVRKIVELGHRIRKEQNIKVRQPLSILQIEKQSRLGGTKELLAIIADELNIKKVVIIKAASKENSWIAAEDKNIKIAIYTAISPVLRQEGLAREIIRAINGLRKELNLTPNDIVSAVLDTNDAELKDCLEKWGKEISNKCRFKILALKEIKTNESAQILNIEGNFIKIKINTAL